MTVTAECSKEYKKNLALKRKDTGVTSALRR